jgi:ADP-ribose pyrophosphatase YjhB (NUDIX family)
MATERLFLRVSRNPGQLRLSEIPDGGFCLSAFLVISDSRNPRKVLLGHLNPDAPWDHIGALDPPRVEMHKNGWMLPSSQLVVGESPQEAANRILTEQLDLNDQKLEGPHIFSEVYGEHSHWDLEFVFMGKRKDVKSTSAWRELEFVDTSKLKKEDFARLHQDILANVGKWKPA